MSAIRQLVYGTVESGELLDVIRIELPHMHVWLYPEHALSTAEPVEEARNGRAVVVVRMETEMKSSPEVFPLVDTLPSYTQNTSAAFGRQRRL